MSTVTVQNGSVTSPPPSRKLALKLSECSCPGVLLVACRRCASSRSIRLGTSVVLGVPGIFHGIPELLWTAYEIPGGVLGRIRVVAFPAGPVV